MKDSKIIKLLYETAVGRVLLKGLVHPKLSRAAAVFLSSKASSRLVPAFVKKNHIDLSYYEIPQGGYASFNDFFTRKMKEEYLIRNGGEFVCPSDGLLTVQPIDENLIFNIKHTKYSVKELLRDEVLAQEFLGGTALVFRLTPAHYHRYVFCASGRVAICRRIRGVLHSVQPVCHEHTKVFVQNSREYTVIENDRLGKVAQMEVGAMLVGKISNYRLKRNQSVTRGQEKGFFEYGGSSIVVLTKKAIELSGDIAGRAKAGDEIPVRMGERLEE